MKYSLKDSVRIFQKPLLEIVDISRTVHKNNFKSKDFQISSLLSIKTGQCPENCKYCSQSAHYKTGIEKSNIIENIDMVINQAEIAKKNGAQRFCLSAAWKFPKDNQIIKTALLISKIKNLGLETCCTLGSINKKQALILKDAGLDFYNHNIDSSEDFYSNVVTTRTFQERIATIKIIKEVGIKVCSGIIIGMGESDLDRVKALYTLSEIQPLSLPINVLVKVPGTPMGSLKCEVSDIELIRTVSLARILMPKTYIRLSAGRESRSEGCQAMCIFAGANSFFLGEKLLTVNNSKPSQDMKMLENLI